MNLPTCLCWLLAVAVTASYANHHHHEGGNYFIYTLRSPHMGDDLNISVSIFNVTEDTHINVELQESRNKTTVVTLDDVISPNSTKMLHLPTETLLDYSYQLVINGTGGAVFSDSTHMYFSRGKKEEKGHAIFIQTDKPVYKPRDKVKFRIFGIHAADLLASKSPMIITVVDAKQNTMQRWTNIHNKTGVLSLEYELSDKPVLGDWSIRAEQEGLKKTVYLPVKEYVLPEYKVEVTAPKFAYNFGYGYLFADEENVSVSISAKYAFGKSVHGQLVFNATIDDSSDGVGLNFVQKFDGLAHITFNLKDFAKMDVVHVPRYSRYCTPRKITFRAMVTEELTGKKMFSEPVSTSFVNSPIELKFDTPIIIKRGLPTKVKLQVSRRDEKMLTEDDRHHPLEVITSHGSGLEHTTKYHIPKNGSIEFNLLVPPNEDGSAVIKAKYTGKFGKVTYDISEQAYPREFHNEHDENIEVALIQERVHVGDDIKVFLNSTTPIAWVLITTFSNDKMLSNKLEKMEGKMSFVLEIPTSDDMIPSASVLISCITEMGKFMIDASTAKISIELKNDVVGTFSESEGQPGTYVYFKGRTMPGSTVFVMAVDKKLHILESAEYITEKKVYDALIGSENFNSWRQSTDNPFDIVSNLGVHMMTNYIKVRRHRIMYHQRGRFIGESAPMGPVAVPVAANSAVLDTTTTPRIRKNFPETWIWVDTEATDSGEFSFINDVPDSITTWQANAFAFHPEKGLGIMKDPAQFLSHQDFFVHLVLPYSLIRGESFVLKVSIFSNLTKDQEVTVTLLDTSQFKLNDSSNKQTVTVKAHGDNTVQFLVVSTEVGNIPIKIRAECELAADEIHKKILVKAEGYPLHDNKVMLAKVVNDEPTEFDYEVKHRAEAVKDSERVEVSVIADIMGPSLEGLGYLIRMPSGCGEQNMVNMAPNIYIHNYLEAELKLTPEQFKMIKLYTEKGYKNQLQYQHSDGSFSAFGSRDKSGSTWLTAFVLRCFGQARKSIPEVFIDEEIIRQGVVWLVRQRTKQNLFAENGRVIHGAMQGGAGKGEALTAYTLISLFENQEIMPNITKPLIAEVADSLPIHDNDTYTLGMMLYLMALTNDAERFEIIESILEEKAIFEDDMKHWKIESDTDKFGYYESPSTGIEHAAYVLMAYTKKGMIEEGIPIMKWLMSQRNSLGGFYSTQDTVLGLEALALFATHVKSPELLTVTVTSDNTYTYTFPDITPVTSTILYKHVLPSEAKNVHIKAEGKTQDDATYTYAMIQIASEYNIKLGSADNIFEGKAEFKALSSTEMALNICHKYKKMNISGMVLIEAILPSGYSLIEKSKLLAAEHISKVDVDDTKIILYLNELTTNFSCYELKAVEVYEVKGHVSPLPVKIRLYYEPDKELVTMYHMTGGSE